MSDSGIKIEVHLIQNFAPSNLNRDDTGQPKSATFGGFRRARISSQCSKRSARRAGPLAELLELQGALRTRQLIVEIAQALDGTEQPDEKVVETVASVFEAGGLERPARRGGKTKKTKGQESDEANEDEEEGGDGSSEHKSSTKMLVFLDREALPKLVKVFRDDWDDLTKGKRETKEAARDKVGRLLFEAVRAPDIALFGRMLEVKSNTPFGKYNMRVEAACQVAHPISTHKVDMEMDFYTAVDDLNPVEETGAGMMGVVGFNSACYYRYALVDRDQLARNLSRKTERSNGDWAEQLVADDYGEADKVIRAFLEAMVYAIPTGKQNSFAAQNLPSFGLFVRRQGGVPISLANAFAQPVRSSASDDDIVGLSVAALSRHWSEIQRVYGTQGAVEVSCFHVGQGERLNGLAKGDSGSVSEAIDAVMEGAKLQ
ncbi:MAG: type I-E CRISPR-associated protein Cas7/Cse4/CasC [Candidatus Bipolaricaulis sp.]|nr:type I-E CRISPR-associated protein Cas7/Cse4/CasC [Candidatus Bipolaricaulis sp.]